MCAAASICHRYSAVASAIAAVAALSAAFGQGGQL